MPTYTLFGQPTVTDGPDGGVGTRTYGLWFQLSQSASLTGIWFYSVAGASVLPTECEIWQSPSNALVAGTQNLSPSWSGAAGSGWVKCSYGGTVTLSSGVWYCAAVGQSGGSAVNWAAIHLNYWSSGPGASGLTNGIITAPSNAGSPTSNQNAAASGGGAPGQFPASGVAASNFWVDVEVTVGGASHTATASLSVSPSVTAARTRGHSRTGTLAVTPSLSASRTLGHSRTASRPVSPSVAASRTAGRFRTTSRPVAPSVTTARTRGHYRTAALAPAPAVTVTRRQGHARQAAVTVTAAITAARTASRVRTAALQVIPALRATASRITPGSLVLYATGRARQLWAAGKARNGSD